MDKNGSQVAGGLDDLLIFVPGDSREFGERVALHLGIATAPLEERDFEDGEHKLRPLGSVRGRDVVVLQSLYGDPKHSVNDKLCRLLFFIGALKDSAAARVTAVVPYLAYARKDRKTQPRDPVTTRYVAALFEAVGCDTVVTMDVHNLAAFQNAFRCRTEHLEAASLFASHFSRLAGGEEMVIVSPDAGGIKRAERFRLRLSRTLGRPVGAAFAEKHRSQGVVSGELLVGDVAGKTAVIVDDLISSGSTIVRTARACRSLGAARVLAAATHGVFAAKAGEVLADPALESVVVTDTIPPFRIGPGALKDKLVLLDSTPLFAEAIRRMHSNGSLTDLLES